MSTNVIRVNGDYKLITVQGGNITLDAGSSGSVSIKGNLTVTGGYTSVSTDDTAITDNIIYLNSGEPETHSGISLGESGIEMRRGGHVDGHAQMVFKELITWPDPNNGNGSKFGLFVFRTTVGGICGIKTTAINTGGQDLNLINSGNGVVTVYGTHNYEDNVSDDDDIPNKKYLDNRIATISAVGKVTLTQPAVSATLTIANSKTLTVNNTLTFSGTDSSNVAFGTGGTVVYTSNKINDLAGISATELAGKITGTTGTDNLVFATSPSLTTPLLGVATATSINKVVITAPATSAILTIANTKTLTANNTLTFTGTDSSSINFGTGGTVLYTTATLSTDYIASTNSDQLRGVINDETGTGKLVFGTSPTLTTPLLGVATATSINKVVITAPATSATLTIADGKTLTASNTLTFTGTDSSDITFGAGGTVAYTANKLSVFSSTSASELAGVISEKTGSGSLVFSTSPSLTTPSLGVATATKINGLIITSTDSTLTISSSKSLTVNNTLTFTGNDGVSVAFGAGGTVAYTSAGYLTLTSLSIDTPNAASGSGSIGYDNTTGKFKYTPPDLSSYVTGTPWTSQGYLTGTPWTGEGYLTLTSLSIDTPNAASGSGSIGYDNATGKFKYTPPDLSSYVTGTPWTSQGYITITSEVSQATSSSTVTSIGYLGIPQNSQPDDYFTEVGDQGKHIYITASKTVTIDGEINYPIGTTIDFITAAGVTATIDINIQTMYQCITGSTGTRTLAPFGRASAIKVDTTIWYISGIGLT